MCLWINQEGCFPLSIEMRLYSEQRTVLVIFLHQHNFRIDIRTILFVDSQKDLARNICYHYSFRTVGDSLKEHNSHPPPPPNFTCLLLFMFVYIINAYTLIFRHALCQTYVCMILKSCKILLYIFDNNIFFPAHVDLG